jgi:hypothetical protein
VGKSDTLLEQSNQIAYLQRELNRSRTATESARERSSQLNATLDIVEAENTRLRADNVRQREEIAELRALLQGATANVTETQRELDALADHVGRSVRPPAWLRQPVAEHGVVSFARTWLGRSTPNSARVAGRVIEAAHE